MFSKFLAVIVFTFTISYTLTGHSQQCQNRLAVSIGSVQTPLLNESSGIAFSKRFPDRLYHINDSGSAPEFFISKTDGTDTLKVPINMGFFLDTEDIAVGPCLGESSCLVVGDIGGTAQAIGVVVMVGDVFAVAVGDGRGAAEPVVAAVLGLRIRA